MEMTPDEFAKFRKALFDRLEVMSFQRSGPVTWEEFKRQFSIASAQAKKPSDDGPPSVVPQYPWSQSFCDCGQPFSTYKMRKDEFGEDFPACSRCGLRLQL